jgi:hypothetical protein
VGYTGRIVVARSARPLAELAAVGGVPALSEVIHGEGWRVATLDGDLSRGGLRALVNETGQPALWAYVLDSDMADVQALTPLGVSWHAYLHEESALSYGAPELAHPVDEVIRQALGWADEAGLTPSEETLRAVFAADGVFAEDTLADLLGALGIHGGTQPPR